jgi:hypothetical protein
MVVPDLTLQDIANWADDEGGVMQLWFHGVDEERIADPELRKAWKELNLAAQLIDRVAKLLPEPNYEF